jgi:predicted phage-related endonuclease
MKVKEALYGEFDVTENRSDFIGGSDIPVILGISKFKTRWQLLLEKAKLDDFSFPGNRYTEYGHMIEPKIREHINRTYNTNFVPNRVIDGDIRYHSDGFDGTRVLEVKSTSEIYASAETYKVYLVQLLKGMELNGVQQGILAVYDRPADLNPEFDPSRLQVFNISIKQYLMLLDHVNREIDKFRLDLERLKENPLLSEQDFLPAGSLVTLADKVAKFENQLSQMKEIEAQLKDAKKALYNEMVKRNVKSWTMPNGTKITMVAEVPASTKRVTEFDKELFMAEHPEMYHSYCHMVEKNVSGKSGYVRISVK